ncbi:MAG: DEAD/DEAH box helicase [Fuerstiella sp.]
MNTSFTGPEETSAWLHWFNDIWGNAEITDDVKQDVLSQLESIYSTKSPEMIYFLTLFNLFHDSLDEVQEDKIIKSKTGIKDTLVWSKLYQFQRDGVLGAINKIERYNGCIIADSVGLGKTFEALAIIKYYELRNDRVLVLAPKKLRDNWTIYTVNDKRNLFAGDRFNYDVLNHTDLTRTTGKSGEINLETVNWGNYDLIVIDESHNFRNSTPRKDRITRYSRLMNEIIRSGVKTKVLMLSATPVNSRMNDLKNQVAFITEGQDDALAAEGIMSLEQCLKNAQTRFNQWLQLSDDQRRTDTLLNMLNFDYFKVLDLLTIARSRKHVEKYYDTSDIGDFPERLKPVNIKADIDASSLFAELQDVNRDIRRLNLAAFAQLKYVRPDKLEEYSRKYDIEVDGGNIFRQVDREESLIHLMRVNLLKRMESSINSFALTVERLLGGVRAILKKLEAHEQTDFDDLKIEDIEIDDPEFESILVGNKVKVLLQDVDTVRWKQELEEDESLFVRLLREARDITPDRDDKLLKLKRLIREKCETPINGDNRKVIVFTAFADTANYLYDNIAVWAQETLGVYSATVSGVGSNQTTMPGIRRDLSSIITSFSPISKERDKISPELTDQVDILIATDCISEGQNLQDCDYLVNYDIHWNPVRIIQRFGRVDRLGSQNKVIQLVNFWPNMELDEYINLEARVSGRMVLLDISATGEENVIDTSSRKMNDLEYRRRQLEQLQSEVVDMEDLSNGISITDMTLNDFRMNLGDYLKQHASQLEGMPPGVFAVTTVDDLTGDSSLQSGVLFCLKSESKRIRVDSTYALAPYYLIYVSDSGEVMLTFTQARKVLDALKKLSLGRMNPDDRAVRIFNERTRNGKDMGLYQTLLGKAVAAITGKAEEKGVESLFQRGGTVMSKDAFRGIDDFEVIAYLIVVEAQTSPVPPR